ncbi:hypothetical protein L596_015127 [Steinernema carpocapsae]|uniref:Protein kinase domain-containing protein n=2 Tax=Steinernema carpocapsae TaxID=34508 RepID=A0A4U5NE12_STECR|nr:hypothetical protein L596_015127 [Steinernema carpocapsae]
MFTVYVAPYFRMSLIANFDDVNSFASTSSIATVPSESSLSSDDSQSDTVSSQFINPSSRVPTLSRKRRAANVLPFIRLGGAAGSTNSAAGGSPVESPTSQDSDEAAKRLRTSGSESKSDDQIAEIECSQGSVSSTPPISGAKKIVHEVEGYEFISPAGKDLVACHVETSTVMQVTILGEKEVAHFQKVVSRLEEAHKYSNRTPQNLKKMKEMIIPPGCDYRRSESNGRHYIFVPMYRDTLHSITKKPPVGWSESQIQPLFRQIVRLVNFCHEIGINMRDLKLRKFVFVDKEFTQLRLFSVLDLMVCEDPKNDLTSERQGCPAYVSPEILDKDTTEYAGRPADIWALGVLMFVLLTKKYPFYDNTPQLLFQRIRAGRYSIPESANLSYPAKQVIHMILRKNPKERPTAKELLVFSWFKDPLPQEPERASCHLRRG